MKIKFEHQGVKMKILIRTLLIKQFFCKHYWIPYWTNEGSIFNTITPKHPHPINMNNVKIVGICKKCHKKLPINWS